MIDFDAIGTFNKSEVGIIPTARSFGFIREFSAILYNSADDEMETGL